MLIIAHACADFTDGTSRNVIFSVKPKDINLLLEAPEAIKKDVMFQMMVADGSVMVPEGKAEVKTLENDPTKGITAEGKAEVKAEGKASSQKAKTEKAAEKKSDKDEN